MYFKRSSRSSFEILLIGALKVKVLLCTVLSALLLPPPHSGTILLCPLSGCAVLPGNQHSPLKLLSRCHLIMVVYSSLHLLLIYSCVLSPFLNHSLLHQQSNGYLFLVLRFFKPPGYLFFGLFLSLILVIVTALLPGYSG